MHDKQTQYQLDRAHHSTMMTVYAIQTGDVSMAKSFARAAAGEAFRAYPELRERTRGVLKSRAHYLEWAEARRARIQAKWDLRKLRRMGLATFAIPGAMTDEKFSSLVELEVAQTIQRERMKETAWVI